MSRTYPAEQVEHGFLPHRLKNWEVPDNKAQKVSADTRFSTLKPRSGRTQFVADDRGYLLPGQGKFNNSFRRSEAEVPVFAKSPARWPKENPAIPAYQRATMGYKGIQNAYLPTSTVTIKTVEVRGSKEDNFNFR